MSAATFTSADLEAMSRPDMVTQLKSLRAAGHDVGPLNAKTDALRQALAEFAAAAASPQALGEITNSPAQADQQAAAKPAAEAAVEAEAAALEEQASAVEEQAAADTTAEEAPARDILESVLYDSDEETTEQAPAELLMDLDESDTTEDLPLPTPVPRHAAAATSPGPVRAHTRFDEDGEVDSVTTGPADAHPVVVAGEAKPPAGWTPVKCQSEVGTVAAGWTPVKDHEDALQQMESGAAAVDFDEAAYRDTTVESSPPAKKEWCGNHTHFEDASAPTGAAAVVDEEVAGVEAIFDNLRM